MLLEHGTQWIPRAEQSTPVLRQSVGAALVMELEQEEAYTAEKVVIADMFRNTAYTEQWSGTWQLQEPPLWVLANSAAHRIRGWAKSYNKAIDSLQ